MKIRSALFRVTALLLAGVAVQAAIGLVGQYTVHPGYIQRKLFVSEKIGAAGYYRMRIDIPKEYGALIANVPVNKWPMLWYENAEGMIRNVEIHDSFANPLVFERDSHAYLN